MIRRVIIRLVIEILMFKDFSFWLFFVLNFSCNWLEVWSRRKLLGNVIFC